MHHMHTRSTEHHHLQGRSCVWELRTATAAAVMTWQGRQRRRDGHDPAQWQSAVRSESRTQCRAWGVSHTRVGTWLWWPRRGGEMASPLCYGRSARDITNVMQKLQGRCENAYSHCSTWVHRSFRGDSVPCTGLRHVSSADNSSNFPGILNVIVFEM